jgi:glutamate/tyrosine decarboxylase-like PLP-dependent enzyme
MDILNEIERDMAFEEGERFLRVVADYLAQTRVGDGPVSTPHTPAELAARFAEPMPRAGAPPARVVERVVREIIPDSNKLYHPMYMGHQVSAPLPAAIWMESVTAALNNSTAVWEMSPTGTVIEAQVVRWLCELAGFGKSSGGTLTTGGTEATFTALLAARASALPNAWQDGVGADAPAIVYGEHAHYAVTRAAGELGLGMRSAIPVPSRDWRIDVRALRERVEALIAEGRTIMAVVATAGSTATGSFDDLAAIADVCDAHGLWLHVDAAHGGSALFSAAHRHRVAGLSRARSVAWDPHKMMLLPLSAGVVLMRDERDLEAAFAQRAPYLFHGAAEGERSWDQGTRSFMCSRRADAFKVWVALQRYGADGIGALYDRLCDTTRVLFEILKTHPDFITFHEPESNILCFRYTRAGMSDEELDALNRAMRERYNQSGVGWITTTVLGGRRVLRVTLMNPRTDREHVERLVEGLLQIAGSL